MSKAVLDASALLALLLREPGAELVSEVVYRATVSAVNYSEVLKKVIERDGDVVKMSQLLDRQSLHIVAFDRERAVAAATILPHTQCRGLSFADRACLATGLEFGLPVFTSEKRISETTLNVPVMLIRERKEH